MAVINIRTPSFSKTQTNSGFESPDIAFLSETWNVTHSTLPMWKDKRNVTIAYTPLDPSKASISKESTDRIDDVVSYQGLASTKISTIRGVDTAEGDRRSEWNWRGSGWLKLITSHWEVIGWGVEESTGNKWVVTIFAKTAFTPAGIDIYSRDRTGISAETLAGIKNGLANTGDDSVKEMASQLFELVINNPSKKTAEQ